MLTCSEDYNSNFVECVSPIEFSRSLISCSADISYRLPLYDLGLAGLILQTVRGSEQAHMSSQAIFSDSMTITPVTCSFWGQSPQHTPETAKGGNSRLESFPETKYRDGVKPSDESNPNGHVNARTQPPLANLLIGNVRGPVYSIMALPRGCRGGATPPPRL
jgi:hypothetical protein